MDPTIQLQVASLVTDYKNEVLSLFHLGIPPALGIALTLGGVRKILWWFRGFIGHENDTYKSHYMHQ